MLFDGISNRRRRARTSETSEGRGEGARRAEEAWPLDFKRVSKKIVENRKDIFNNPVTKIYKFTDQYIIYTARDKRDHFCSIKYHLADKDAEKMRANLAVHAAEMARISDLVCGYAHTRTRESSAKAGR